MHAVQNLPPATPATRKKVVVIDDERTVQATLTAVLQRHGFDVATAPNAAQGRRKVEEMKPDLVLLDLGLPDVGGLERPKSRRSANGAKIWRN